MKIDFRWTRTNDALDKYDFNIEPFMRVWWYYKDEWEAYQRENDEEFNPRKYPPHSGIVIPQDGTTSNGYIDIDQAGVIIDKYPVEKHYCRYTYVSFAHLLDDINLVEIIDQKDE